MRKAGLAVRVVALVPAGSLSSSVAVASDNVYIKWTNNSYGGYSNWITWQFDSSFPTTAAHEFGHLVALHHSDREADTMWPFLPCGTLSKRSLEPHDKDGIRALYPAH